MAEIDKYFHLYGTKDKIIFDEVANPEQKWIPVSERLPEMKKPILATYKTEDGLKVDRTMFDRYGFLIGEVTAWMPLPEPYSERRTDEND